MNLRIIPAVPTAPTVIFSLNWHSLPPSLPFPHFYSTQLAACRDSQIQSPRNSLALDKAVGITLLLDSVTFDLTKDVVVVSCIDGQVFEWNVNDSTGFKAALESVLQCVKDSGVEAEKEKKAAVAAASGSSAPSQAASASSAASSSSTASSSAPSIASNGKRHRTASGIFSSFVAAFVNPPPSSLPATNVPADTPPHLAHLYAFRARRKAAAPTYHRQHFLNPRNKREQFPNAPVPQSRYLRRQARAKLVDIFRLFVESKITQKLRSHGIIGDELKTRGVLDDLEEGESDEKAAGPSGVSGYEAAGGYVGFMARSLLKKTIVEINKDEDDSYSSSDDSVLLTPRDGDDSSIIIPDPSSIYNEDESKQRTPSRVTSPTPTPARSRRPSSPHLASHSRQLRHLSAVLIGMAQKDKRSQDDERQLDQSVMEKSLRKRWAASEQGGLAPSRTRAVSAPSATFPSAARRYAMARPAVGSPLKNCEVLYRIPLSKAKEESLRSAVPFPANTTIIHAPQPMAPRRTPSLPPRIPTPPLDEEAEEKQELAKESPICVANPTSRGPSPLKAKEAEDVADADLADSANNANGRARCSAILPTSVPSTSPPSKSRSTNPGMIMSTIPEIASEAFPVDVTDAFDGDDLLSPAPLSFRTNSDPFPVSAIFEDEHKTTLGSRPYAPAPEPTTANEPPKSPTSPNLQSPFRYEFAPRPSEAKFNSKNSSLAHPHASMHDVQIEIDFHETGEGYQGRGAPTLPILGESPLYPGGGIGLDIPSHARGGGYWAGIHDGIYVVA